MLKERIKDFMAYVKNRYTEKEYSGGCETCGYGARTIGEHINSDDLFHNLDQDIDDFIEQMRAENRKP